MEYRYQIYVPGGNDTALVFGMEQDPRKRKVINAAIMAKHSNVEQVGFVNKDKSVPELMMAGGEFCGNATRTAAWYYRDGQPGDLVIQASGAETLLRAGVSENGDAWAQMPVGKDLRTVRLMQDGIYLAALEGITHVVILPGRAKTYLESGKDLMEESRRILREYKLDRLPAAGVLYLEEQDGQIKMHPYVYVSAVNTTFYETACGSGTISVGLVKALLTGGSVDLAVIQPSSKTVRAIVDCAGNAVQDAVISGVIETDGAVYLGEA